MNGRLMRDIITSTQIGIQDDIPSVSVSAVRMNSTSSFQRDFSVVCLNLVLTIQSDLQFRLSRLFAPSFWCDFLAVEETTQRTAKRTPRIIDGAAERVPVAEWVPPSVSKPTTKRESESASKEASAMSDKLFRARFWTRISDWFLVTDKIDSRWELF